MGSKVKVWKAWAVLRSDSVTGEPFLGRVSWPHLDRPFSVWRSRKGATQDRGMGDRIVPVEIREIRPTPRRRARKGGR